MNFLKKIYLFFGSVKLAIPVMLCLLGASVAGTLFESKYNAEYAGIVIYKTWWFMAILFLLFINILLATFTRLPWKKRHLGFLITHLGMLLLLIGSVMTMVYGIDGTMQIMEGSDSNLVFLQNNVIEVDRKTIPIKRYIEKYDISANREINSTEFKFVSYLPFVDVPEKSFDRGINLNFKIKSAFFDVIQVLNDELDREVQMGPATFRIVSGDLEKIKVDEVKNVKHATKRSITKGDKLFLNKFNGNEITSFDISSKKSFKYEDINIEIVRKFKNAQIVSNKIQEGDPAGSNPALEIKVTKGSSSLREIIYQNIPTFSLNAGGVFGLSFRMTSEVNSAEKNSGDVNSIASDANSSLPSGHPTIGNMKSGTNPDRIKNTVEFKIVDKEKNIVEVSLYKNNELLDKKILKKDEQLTTPWMGIEITFKGVSLATDTTVPTETEPKTKMPLPPSAILMRTSANGSSDEKWIVENSEIQVSNGMKSNNIYYGRERLFLPFSLFLEKFEKKDYPGSEMAMNFRSFVKINSKSETKEIYMNEPLKFEGFTFYQSSYQLTPNAPAVTILSVNRDPGRALKYIGSLILCFGIAFYTFQKSKRFAKYLN